MAHLDLGHADMKPAPIVRYEIAQAHNRTRQMLAGSVAAAATIVILAMMLLAALH